MDSTQNNAVMRKALEDALELLESDDRQLIAYSDTGALMDIIRPALGEPPRNCDILSEKEANEAWEEYMHSHVLPRGGWDFHHIIAWLYAKAKEKEEHNG